MTDRISLTGIEVFARHGVHAEEAAGQTFVVDVELEVDLDRAGRSDDLEDTVDYGRLAELVHQTVAGERWNLIERVARRVADVALEDERVTAVEVTIHKPEAPLAIPYGDVSVTIRRSR